jgi:broad specificity phosphatase PhoE
MRLQRITYKGKEIVLADYDGLDPDDFLKEVEENHEEWKRMVERGETHILVLSDVTGAIANERVVKAFQEMSKTMRANTKASAVVGITGLRRFLLRAINKVAPFQTEPFDNRTEAMEWLVKR